PAIAIQRNQVYDPTTDRWADLAPLPEPRDHLAVATVNDKMYVFGGFARSIHAEPGAGAYEVDPAKNAWRTLASMKEPRAAAGAAVVDGKIHVFGGRGNEDNVTFTTHEVYDPATNTWKSAAPMPRARDHMTVVAVDGKIHVIGGRTHGPQTPV